MDDFYSIFYLWRQTKDETQKESDFILENETKQIKPLE